MDPMSGPLLNPAILSVSVLQITAVRTEILVLGKDGRIVDDSALEISPNTVHGLYTCI